MMIWGYARLYQASLPPFFNGQAFIHTVRTSGEKFISSLHCVAKKEKSKRVPELGGRELTDLSPDVLTAYTMAGPW